MSTGPRTGLRNARRPVAFCFNGGLGDRLCNIPALRALSAVFAQRLGLMGPIGDRSTYYSDLPLRAYYHVRLFPGRGGWEFDADELATRIGNCDLLIGMNPWHSKSVDRLLHIYKGVPSVGLNPAYEHAVLCDYVNHAIDMTFAVPRWFEPTIRAEDFASPPWLPRRALERAFDLKAKSSRPYRLFVHTDTRPEKRWTEGRFSQLIDSFVMARDDFAVFLVDTQRTGIYSGRNGSVVTSLDTPFPVSLAALALSDLFVGIDSSCLHAADLFRIPSVGLFGHSSARRWGLRFGRHWNLQEPGSLSELQVEDVLEALLDLAPTYGAAQQGEFSSDFVARASHKEAVRFVVRVDQSSTSC